MLCVGMNQQKEQEQEEATEEVCQESDLKDGE